jgi:hypothetical protein
MTGARKPFRNGSSFALRSGLGFVDKPAASL